MSDDATSPQTMIDRLDEVPVERRLRFLIDLLIENASGELEAKIEASYAILTPEEKASSDAEDRDADLTDAGLGRVVSTERWN